MVSKSTDEHFAEYSANTRIKHEILQRYLKTYLLALSRHVDAVHYIDGFAGRGNYGGTAPGSPILALQLLGQQQKPYCGSFVEAQRGDADELRKAIAASSTQGDQLGPPLVVTGEFAEHVDVVLARPELRPFRRVATFAFVDPCRVKGVRVVDLRKIIATPFGECLIFWNYDGVNRWLGAISAGQSSGEKLKDLFGDTTVLQQAINLSETISDPREKERELLSLMLHALQAHSGATYVLPFRFEARDANRTSHYLIHCSRDGLAFKLMKAVMASLTTSDEPGKFEFLRDSDVASQADLFVPASDVVAAERILDELSKGPRPVKIFYEDWVRRPSDFFSQADYRRLLLQMEERRQLEVLDSDGATQFPRDKRRKIKGEPTLSDRLWVRRL